LAAGRTQDQADVIKLIQANSDQLSAIREYLARVHADYVSEFDRLVQRAHEETEGTPQGERQMTIYPP
jgi:hypothetical protein